MIFESGRVDELVPCPNHLLSQLYLDTYNLFMSLVENSEARKARLISLRKRKAGEVTDE